MQAITLRSAQRPPSGVVNRASRRTTVTVKAWTGDKAPWAGLLRFFVPRKELSTKDDAWPENNYKGQPRGSHDRKPFKDGFMGAKMEPEAPSEVSATTTEASQGAVEYLNEAAERVVNHNFKGDASEPQWGKMGAGARGWSGDVHTGQAHGHEQKGGFHSNIK